MSALVCRHLGVTLVLLLLGSGPPASSSPVSWHGLNGGFSGDDFGLGAGTFAYDFTVAGADVLLTRLGIHDADADGLTGAYDVSVWNTFGDQLALETVPAGSAGSYIDDSWYTSLVSPVVLVAGETYVIGAWYPEDSGDGITSVPWDSSNPDFSAIGLNSSFTPSDSLEFPSDLSGTEQLLGPTFGYSVVPEPSSYALMLCGLAILIFVRHRERYKRKAWSCH